MNVLKVEHKDTICEATIQRPHARNAINFAVMDALEELLSNLETNNRSRCFILKGKGHDAFIAGGDLKEFHTLQTADEAGAMARRMTSILQRIENLPCWTIACINGPAYGGGCEIMLAFDFRIASTDATFGFTQGKFYLPPGWGGITRLVECVGRSTALQWLAETAIIDAKMALNHHLINRTAIQNNLKDDTQKWAKSLCHNNREYIQTVKRGAMHLTEARWKAIEKEIDPFAEFWEDKRHHQRVEKFLDKDN